MADISYLQHEDVEYSDEAMEGEDEEEIGSGQDIGGEGGNSGGGGDGGGGQDWVGEQLLTKLQQNANSDTVYDRQMVGRMLVEVFRYSADCDSEFHLNEVLMTLKKIADDRDIQVKAELLEQLPHIAMISQESPHIFGNILKRHLLPVIQKYVRDADTHLRYTAQKALLVLIERGLLDEETLAEDVAPVVEMMTYMNGELLTSAVALMCKIGVLIGKDLAEKFFLDRYITLCEDHTFYVRKVCASHFGHFFAAVVKPGNYKILLAKYTDLCCDDVWGVRKACTDVMLSVACNVSLEDRRTLLTHLLQKHLIDSSKWIQSSAYQILGPFIATFAKEFTGVNYDQYGQLVFTNQQGNQIRVPSPAHYDLGFGMKYSNVLNEQSHSSVEDDINLFYETTYKAQRIPRREININDLMSNSGMNKENVPLTDTTEKATRDPSTNDEREGNPDNGECDSSNDDIDKFNPFLYYYIPPEMPLDEELVAAAEFLNQAEVEITVKTEEQEEAEGQEEVVVAKESAEETPKPSELRPESDPAEKDEKKAVKDKVKPKNEGTQGAKEAEESPNSSDSELNDTVSVLNISTDDMNKPLDELYLELAQLVMQKKLNIREPQQRIVPQGLINFFISMANRADSMQNSSEIRYQCAFSFPAVTLTLGRENWGYLKDAYQTLAGAMPWKVRLTLASSIHEIAMILGEELTATDLVPIYDGFFKDLDEVRIGALKHLATFLNVLRPNVRCRYLPRLSSFLVTDVDTNWRFRESFAGQLLQAVPLFSPFDVAEYIAPLSLVLLADKYAGVRQAAIALVTRIMKLLSHSQASLVPPLARELRKLLIVNANNWTSRQIYALLCSQILNTSALTFVSFSTEMLPYLLSLSNDKVPNVRLVVARTLSRDVAPLSATWEESLQNELKEKLRDLRKDVDRDVRVLAQESEDSTEELSQSEENLTF